MTVEPTEPVFSNPKTIFRPEILLQGANRASEKVAALHIAFLALCTYVSVIVFSTTDLDLLIGKGVKLPVVDVEVSIKGFYTTVPYLVVLVHFNLLLQLQLLSRKLFAFDEAAPREEAMGGATRSTTQLSLQLLSGGSSKFINPPLNRCAREWHCINFTIAGHADPRSSFSRLSE